MSHIKPSHIRKTSIILSTVFVLVSCGSMEIHRAEEEPNNDNLVVKEVPFNNKAHDPQVIMETPRLDTSLIFGIWTVDPEGPHADFWLTEKSFFVVDYDGDGHMNYELNDNKITVYYPEFDHSGEISHSVQDTLIIKWEDALEPTIYVPFPN